MTINYDLDLFNQLNKLAKDTSLELFFVFKINNEKINNRYEDDQTVGFSVFRIVHFGPIEIQNAFHTRISHYS